MKTFSYIYYYVNVMKNKEKKKHSALKALYFGLHKLNKIKWMNEPVSIVNLFLIEILLFLFLCCIISEYYAKVLLQK